MKEALRQNIEGMRMDMILRIEQLNTNIEDYKNADKFEAAMISDIRKRQLIVVLERLDEALK